MGARGGSHMYTSRSFNLYPYTGIRSVLFSVSRPRGILSNTRKGERKFVKWFISPKNVI